uniref:Uncharacterized protein n=1 Tax=Rhizophora mucronata TaxID=61149 RepID=A0A2P2NL23_RHIMU
MLICCLALRVISRRLFGAVCDRELQITAQNR